MTNSTNVAAKFASVVAGLGLVAMAIAPAAQADTTSALQAQIASLLAQISSLQAQLGGSQTTTTSMMFTTDLTVGSTGASVTALQNWLISKGFTIAAGATGTFGPQTKAALAAYQAANGISPAAGYFGPVTRAKVNASAGTTTGGTTTGGTTSTGPLSGGEGSIDNFKTIGALNTTLNQADSQQVLGFEFKADGSDLAVDRVNFDIVNTGSTGTIRPWGVFQTATLMNGNTTVGTVDLTNANNYSQDGTGANGNQQYRISFSGLKDVVKMGNTVDYTLTLSTQNAISTTNAGGVYSVTLQSQAVRATDAAGIQQYAPSNAIPATVTVGSGTSGSAVLSTGSDNPQTTTVQGDTQNATTGITLNTFTIQAKNSDLMLYSLPVQLATSSGAVLPNMIRSLKLYQGSTLLDTETPTNMAGAATTTFQNLNFKLAAGTTNSFKIVADINRIDGINFAEGSSVTVTVPSYGADIENGSNRVTPTGAASGNPITFRSLGLAVDSAPTTSTSASQVGTTGTQQGSFMYTFNVTSFGQDIFFSKVGNLAVTGTITDQSGVATSTASSTAISSTADTSTGNHYVVHSGQTKQVSVTITVPAGSNQSDTSVLKTFTFSNSDAFTTTSTTTLPSAYQAGPLFLHA
ncbi:MAG: baaA1 [Parcubacteria group bacterium]|nr:baaA1 [Parcubacteria group bacterium]